MARWRHLIGGLLWATLSTAGAPAQAPAGGDEFAADRPTPATLPLAKLAPPGPVAVRPQDPAAGEGPAEYRLDDLIRVALEQDPRLAQAALTIDAARGRALQAGLYPNPTVAFIGDELGDRQGRAGILTVPQVSQEIVTGGKLTLSRAAAEREVDQATLALAARRADLLAGVRAAYFDVLTLQERVAMLTRLRDLTRESVKQTRALRVAGRATDVDIAQLEADAARVLGEAEAAEQQLPAAFRRLAAAAGVRDLPQRLLAGPLDAAFPDYELDRLRQYVLSVHPGVRSAHVALERARLLWQRAQAEVTPNVTISGGYVRQNQNRSNDFMVGVSLPVPVWNRNEGNILAAQAEAGVAAREVQRVENDLTARVATAYGDFTAARRRAERLADARKQAEEAFRLITEEKTNFVVTPIQRLVAQQAVTQARLDYLRALGDAWRAASALSGLTLEEQWPPAPAGREAPEP